MLVVPFGLAGPSLPQLCCQWLSPQPEGSAAGDPGKLAKAAATSRGVPLSNGAPFLSEAVSGDVHSDPIWQDCTIRQIGCREIRRAPRPAGKSRPRSAGGSPRHGKGYKSCRSTLPDGSTRHARQPTKAPPAAPPTSAGVVPASADKREAPWSVVLAACDDLTRPPVEVVQPEGDATPARRPSRVGRGGAGLCDRGGCACTLRPARPKPVRVDVCVSQPGDLGLGCARFAADNPLIL